MAFLFSDQKVLKELASLREAVQEAKEAAEAAKNAVERTELHAISETIEELSDLRQTIQKTKEAAEVVQRAAEAIQGTNLHIEPEIIADRDIPSSDKTEAPADFATEPVNDAVIVEVMDSQTDFINDDLLYVSADVKMPTGKKIHIVFSNPQTLGMFELYDKIRVKQKGSKWEFIEHIP